MTTPLVLEGAQFERTLLSLAREFGMDHFPRERILQIHGIPEEEAHRYLDHPRFAEYLTEAVKQWQSGANIEERTKHKYQGMVEEIASSLWVELNDRTQPLSARNELLKTVARIAGMGEKQVGPSVAPGDRVVVNINMGEDYKLVRDNTPPQITIDASPVDSALEDL